jgi:DNA-directed RNA polymerase specialized sigma24 family protein
MTAVTAAPPGRRGDGSLVLAARDGDRLAWDELVGRFSPLLWAVARGESGLSRDAAAEVVQLTWLRCVERLDLIDDPGRVGLWLLASCRRESGIALRRAAR